MIESRLECGIYNYQVRAWDLAEFIHAAHNFIPSAPNAGLIIANRILNGWGSGAWEGCAWQDRLFTQWPEGRARLAEISLPETSLPAVKSRRRKRRFGEEGDDLDLDRYLNGREDCFEYRKRELRTSATGVVRITLELCISSMVDAENLIWTGLSAVALTDKLENAGYRVELVALCTNICTHHGDKHHNSTLDVVRVKDASAPLNIDAALMAVAHPAAFRYWCFANWLMRPVKFDEGLGTTSESPEPAKGDIHIPRVTSARDAADVVRSALEKFSEKPSNPT